MLKVSYLPTQYDSNEQDELNVKTGKLLKRSKIYRVLFIITAILSLAICTLFNFGFKYDLNDKERAVFKWHTYVTAALFIVVTILLVYWIRCFELLVRKKFGN